MKKREKYGLLTATAMVVGSVIGSGVFFKTETLINITGGSAGEVLLAWIIGGVCMMMCLLSFGYGAKGENLAQTAEKNIGKGYAYYMNWFMATIYYPSLVGVLSWLSARYTLLFLGIEELEGRCIILSFIYIALSFIQNLFPKVSGKIQVATTFLKLIPLVLMIIFGIKNGINTQILAENMSVKSLNIKKTLFPAVSAVVFAYEGWIAGLNIAGELKNSKKNLPLALSLGGGIIATVYIFYYLGIMGSVSVDTFINYGKTGIKIAFSSVFGKTFADLLILFVAISCFGALNGMTFSLVRVMNTIFPDKKRTLSISSILSLLWLLLFFDFSISGKSVFGEFGFEVSEIPIITVYIMYIPIFIMLLIKTASIKGRIIISLGICSSLIIALCAFFAHKSDLMDYILIWSGIMLAGAVCRKK